MKILGIDAALFNGMAPYLVQATFTDIFSVFGVCIALLAGAIAIDKAIRWLIQILKRA